MRLPRVRARHGLYLREGAGAEAQLRFPLGPHDPAAADRARADEEAAAERPHRSPHWLRVQEGAQVQGVPRQAARRQDRLRVHGAGAEAREAGGEARAGGESYTSRFRTPSAFVSMKARRGSTSSPISLVKISSAAMPSSICTFSRRRASMFMVVSQSCSGFISARR